MKEKILIALLLLLVAAPVLAQEEEEAARGFVYGTYMFCDNAQEWLADDVVEKHFKPIYDAAVEEGTISAWGWMSHHTGGKWRRLLYTSAPTMDALLDAREALAEKTAAAAPMAWPTVAGICPSHEDYIWRSVAGSGSDQPRGEAGFSVYFVCDMSRESELDELVEEHIGPVYDAHLGEGKLASWGYMEHVLGGKYRRIATMTAADVKTLMKVRGEVLAALQDVEEVAAFSEICSSHSDYIWMVDHEKP